MAVTVGRVRACPILDLRLVLLGHNTIRGAAGQAVQIAELLVAEGRVDRRVTRAMIVAKFGGTSVADAAAIGRLIGIVRSRAAEQPVVVVSALAQGDRRAARRSRRWCTRATAPRSTRRSPRWSTATRPPPASCPARRRRCRRSPTTPPRSAASSARALGRMLRPAGARRARRPGRALELPADRGRARGARASPPTGWTSGRSW